MESSWNKYFLTFNQEVLQNISLLDTLTLLKILIVTNELYSTTGPQWESPNYSVSVLSDRMRFQRSLNKLCLLKSSIKTTGVSGVKNVNLYMFESYLDKTRNTTYHISHCLTNVYAHACKVNRTSAFEQWFSRRVSL